MLVYEFLKINFQVVFVQVVKLLLGIGIETNIFHSILLTSPSWVVK